MSNPIVLLTDFGANDAFVGIMKGVIATIHPDSKLIDLNHQIPHGDIRRAALTLWQSAAFFPKDSIFLVVVDPGVGTPRRAVITKHGGQLFIGPDNGVFSYVLPDTAAAWELANPEYALSTPGMTFHGRDLFSPAAAYAARGIPPSDFGPAVPDLVRLPAPLLDSPAAGLLRGEILHADHFGNLLTSLGQFMRITDHSWQLSPWFGTLPEQTIDPAQYQLKLPDGRTLPWAKTFGEIPAGTCAALIGSTGLIEIAANLQSAANLLNLHGGELISIESLQHIE
mgnify:CR=1 FL=1